MTDREHILNNNTKIEELIELVKTKQAGTQIDFNSINELNLTYGEETPTYDTTDGMTIRTTSQLKYDTDKTATFDTEFNLPLVPADDSITIGVDEPNKKFTIKSVTTLVGKTDPTTSTIGNVGQLYLNTANNALWVCSAISSATPKTYTWKLLGDGLDTQPRAISTQIYDNTTLASHIDEILGHVNTENGGSLVSISMKLTNAISGEMKSVTTNLSTNTLTNSTSTVNIINAGEAITLTLGAIRNGATSGKKATFTCANDTNMCSFSNIAISNINGTDTATLSGYEFTYGTNSIIHNYFNDINILNADLEHLVINYYAT